MSDRFYIEPHIGDERRNSDLDRAIAALARQQHGRVAHDQLLALGLGPKAIRYG